MAGPSRGTALQGHLLALLALMAMMSPTQAVIGSVTGSDEASSIIGSMPFSFGLSSWTASGNFSFHLSPLSLPALVVGPLLEDIDITATGGWANFSLPGPLPLTYSSTLSTSDGGDIVTECTCSTTYDATAVTVAMRLGQSLMPQLEGCQVVVDAAVQVGSAVRSVNCASSCPVNGTDAALVDSIAVASSIALALKGSLEVLEAVNSGNCSIPDELALELSIPGLEQLRESLPEGMPAEDNSLVATAVAILVVVVLIALSSVLCCGCCMGCCCWKNAEETEAEKQLLDKCHSLVQTQTLPVWAKAAFFLVVSANIAFFVSANISVGAQVNVDYTYQGVFVDLPPVYDFSILNSTIELIKAEIYLLGIFFLGFSVIWPYVKLVILSAMFALPTAWVRPRGRSSVMEWIDVLGKWSMFDVFALCGAMVIFLVEVQSPETRLTPLGYYGINLSVIPVWGMFANLIAQILSQLLSIFALWAHNRAYKADWHALHAGQSSGGTADDADGKLASTVAGDTKEETHPKSAAGLLGASDTGADGKLTIQKMPSQAVMAQELHGADMIIKTTLFGQLLVAVMLLAVIVLVAVGNFETCFTVRVVGLLGLVQELAIPGSSTRYFTPLFVAEQMVASIPDGEPGLLVGTFCIAIIMIASVLVVPIAQAAVLLCIWAVPMPLPRLKSMLKANELLASWQYIEVLLIALIIGCLQIPMVCALLVGDSCDGIQQLLDLMTRLGIMSHATCFNMATKAYTGIWCLFGASVLLYIASIAVRETAFSVTNTYDAFRASQPRELTRQQSLYYSRRSRALRLLGFVKFCGPVASPPASFDPPIASPAI